LIFLEELLEDSAEMCPVIGKHFLEEGIDELQDRLVANNLAIGGLTMKLNVDNQKAKKEIEIMSHRLDIINQQIDRAVEELESFRTKIKIGVEVNE